MPAMRAGNCYARTSATRTFIRIGNTNYRFMKKLMLLPFLLVCIAALAQDSTNLDNLLEMETQTPSEPKAAQVVQIFRGTRVSNGHSTETLPAKVLDAKIQHRFGYINSGFNSFFGLDDANIRIGFDYGITNKLMIGLGRASFQKQYDCYLKYKILDQKSNNSMPLTLAVLGSAMVQGMPTPDGQITKTRFRDRGFYAGQLLLARRFGKVLSLQVMPTIVHYNIVPLTSDPNDIISIGGAAGIRLSSNTSLVFEYYYNLPGHKFDHTQNALSIGFDIETAGHVFQLLLTNGSGIAERPFITETTGKFFDGDIRFGFNVSRLFQAGKFKRKNRS
jgi:hypothetical protein